MGGKKKNALREALVHYADVLRDQVFNPAMKDLAELEETQIKDFLANTKADNLKQNTVDMLGSVRRIDEFRTRMSSRMASIENRINKA